MSEHLFLLLNPLILRSSLLLSELWRDNLRKTKRHFTNKNAQSPPEPGCSGLIENGRALAIISPSFPHHNYKTQCSPLSRRVALKGIRLDLEWKAAAQNVSTVTKKKVIYLGTSARCHIYPRKRQRSRQVTPDTSETCTGRGERLLLQLKTEAIGLQHKKSSQTLRLFFFER